jgi:hypothetical protein
MFRQIILTLSALLSFCDICVAQQISPVPVAEWPELHRGVTLFASRLKKSNDRLFVQPLNTGIQVLDISNPANPRPIPTRLPQAQAMDVVDSNVFLIDSEYNLKMYNASDPGNPQLFASLPLVPHWPAVAAAGNLVFVTTNYSTIQVIDISTPSSLIVRTNIGGALSSIQFLEHVGDFIYAFGPLQTNVGYWSLLKIIDAQTAELVSEVLTPGSQANFCVAGSTVYLSESTYDCSDPKNPTLQAPLPYLSPSLTKQQAVLVLGATNRLFVTSYAGVVEFDASEPYSPVVLSQTRGSCVGMVANGDFLYVARNDSVVTYQISGQPPAIPSLQISSFGDTHDIRWINRFGDLKLLTAPTPFGPWTLNSGAVLTNDYNYNAEVMIPGDGQAGFYRLQQSAN